MKSAFRKKPLSRPVLLHYFFPLTGYPYEGRKIDCPVCGSADHAQIARLDRRLKRLSTDLCHHCGLFFTNPMPTSDELNRYYATTYRAEYQFAFLKPRKTHRNKKQKEAIRRSERIKEIAGLDGAKRTLDFGCGSGELVHRLAELGCAAQGFEQGEDYGAFAQSELEGAKDSAIHVGSWREMPFAPGSFDIISCLHVLEHLNEPTAALAKIHDWLAPEGVFYLETPDMQNYVLKGFDVFHFAHVLGFSRANLMYATEKAGFRLLHEDGPTSLLLVKADHPKARDFDYSLEETVKRNLKEYAEGVTPLAYAKRHAKRIGKIIRTEAKGGR